jgi:hypothetical protein
MDRFGSRNVYGSRLWLGLLLACLTATSGCQLFATPLAMTMWVIQGNKVKAKFAGLRGKRVAVVCRPSSSLQYRYAGAARELAARVGTLLNENVPKIKIIEQSLVADYTDENDWDTYVEIGKAVDAEIVVAIDLRDFNLYQGATVYQGKANMTVAVYDVTKGREPVHTETPPQATFPPHPIATSDVSEPQFRAQFVSVLAEQVARYFYDHNAGIELPRAGEGL